MFRVIWWISVIHSVVSNMCIFMLPIPFGDLTHFSLLFCWQHCVVVQLMTFYAIHDSRASESASLSFISISIVLAVLFFLSFSYPGLYFFLSPLTNYRSFSISFREDRVFEFNRKGLLECSLWQERTKRASAQCLSPTKDTHDGDTRDEKNVDWSRFCTNWGLHQSWIFTWEKREKKVANTEGKCRMV